MVRGVQVTSSFSLEIYLIYRIRLQGNSCDSKPRFLASLADAPFLTNLSDYLTFQTKLQNGLLYHPHTYLLSITYSDRYRLHAALHNIVQSYT
jgi:hypothetical protein